MQGLDDCIDGNPVFHAWAHSWTRRIIVRNALRMIAPDSHSRTGEREVSPSANNSICEGPPLQGVQFASVLALRDFVRLVYVLSVLERDADQNCAVLLGVSRPEVREAAFRHFNMSLTFRDEPRATFITTRSSLVKQRSNQKRAKGSVTMTRTSEYESVFASTAVPNSLGVFVEGDLSNPRHYTDEELVTAAQNGYSSALGMLLTRHRRILYGNVRRMTATAEEAEDVVQDAMLRVCMSIGTFRREARFSSWLITIATNSLLSSRRRVRPTQWIYLDDTKASHQWTSYELRDLSPTPEQESIDRELLHQTQREMRKLHRSYREVLATRDIDQELIGNSARDLGISVATFKTRLRRGRSQLSQVLGRMRVTRSTIDGSRRRRG